MIRLILTGAFGVLGGAVVLLLTRDETAAGVGSILGGVVASDVADALGLPPFFNRSRKDQR